jgi:phosphate-selective porin OprO/OprP
MISVLNINYPIKIPGTNKRVLPVSCILLVFQLIPFLFYAQDTLKVVPDGTEGEVLLTPDSLNKAVKTKKPWNQINLGFTTLKIGVGFLYEFATYAQDEKGEIQTDSIGTALEPTFKTRDFRVLVSGKIKSKRSITWKAGIMYDAPTDEWFIRESGIMIGVPELWGHFFIGRTKEGYSLNKVMNGYAGWTMERQIGLDVIPILADGIKWLGWLPKPRIIWNVGGYADWLSHEQGFSTFEWQVAARVAWLPIYSEKENKLIHLGVNYRHGAPENGKMRLRSRPEAFPAPYFIDTETFPSDYSNSIGWEAYFKKGSLMIGTEYNFHGFDSEGGENILFNGGDLAVSYIFTGESRPYTTAGGGIFGFVPVKRPLFKGGPGAIEAVLRVSHLDLDDGSINGGKFWRITPMINWYATSFIRLEFAYGYGELDRFGIKGKTQLFQSRIQIAIL